MPKPNEFHSGFIAILGKPNVGKSTLLNHIMGKKISIVSPRVQTTRQRILGVKTSPDHQMIFVDTPGLLKSRTLLGKTMVKHSQEALLDCDLCLFLVSAAEPGPTAEDLWAYGVLRDLIKERNPVPPVFLLVNKVDAVKNKNEILPLIEKYSKLGNFSEIFPISALKGENLDSLEHAMVSRLPAGPAYYPGEETNPQDETFHIAEVIREKVLFYAHQEVPHGVAVAVEEIRPGKSKNTLYIQAVIYVEKESHKAILVGEGGKRLKAIGTRARQDLSREKSRPVFLDLWVKVKQGWRDREEMLRQFGYS